MSCLIDI